jgi:hypothetical protein
VEQIRKHGVREMEALTSVTGSSSTESLKEDFKELSTFAEDIKKGRKESSNPRKSPVKSSKASAATLKATVSSLEHRATVKVSSPFYTC